MLGESPKSTAVVLLGNQIRKATEMNDTPEEGRGTTVGGRATDPLRRNHLGRSGSVSLPSHALAKCVSLPAGFGACSVATSREPSVFAVAGVRSGFDSSRRSNQYRSPFVKGWTRASTRARCWFGGQQYEREHSYGKWCRRGTTLRRGSGYPRVGFAGGGRPTGRREGASVVGALGVGQHLSDARAGAGRSVAGATSCGVGRPRADRRDRLTVPPQGPEQRREAPADRSGAERGLAPDREAGPHEGGPTGPTENERRCGRGGGVESSPSTGWRGVARKMHVAAGRSRSVSCNYAHLAPPAVLLFRVLAVLTEVSVYGG